MKKLLYVSLLVIMTVTAFAQSFRSQDILSHIKTLADDKMGGRGTGTDGEKMAADYIEKSYKKFSLLPAGDAQSFRQTFDFKRGVHGEGEAGRAANIVGRLDNGAATTVIIGAHYDHLGMDGQGSSLDANPKEKIHNGADDNASGVAGVLELARYFSTNKVKENVNFLFLCFTGEEMGLLGSKYFADHSPVALDQVAYMINMDMVGRLDPSTKALMVHGTGTSPVWEPLLKELANDKLSIKTDSSGTGPSDHTSFYLKDIPVLHFFTGAHSDYHKPSDDWEKINAEGEADVLTLITKIIHRLETQPKIPFLKTKTKPQATRSSFKVTMGIMPSYASESGGLKVDGVTEGRPGQKAGIQTGDVIIKIGDYAINDIQQYMDALGKFEKGQTVIVKLKRNNEVIDLNLTF